jgi:hypothetical protein
MIPLLVAYAAAPKVVPVIVAALVFIVLAGISIGIGSSEKMPGWVTFFWVAVSAGLAGWAYKGTKLKMSPNVPHPAGSSSVAQDMPVEAPRSLGGEHGMSPVKMPASIMP